MKHKKLLAVVLCVTLLTVMTGCSQKAEEKKSALDPANPVTVTVWNYYNGDQLTAFEDMVEKFNSSVGLEKGIVVVSESQGDIDTLAEALLDSVDGKAGAKKQPSLAAVYAEMAYILDNKKALASYDLYFTKDELSKVVSGFIEEGRFNKNNDLLLYPVTKSTEVFTANKTDWADFAKASGITLESIKTKEDLVKAAKTYYEWTDAKTPKTKEDGKALYGRDSVANYIYLGCYELGQDMFEVTNGKVKVNLNKEAFKTIWDNYYIPYINGYFASYAKFRSEDAKTGKILALTSSSSSVSYLPTTVTLDDDSSHNIEMSIARDLPFAKATKDAVVQQGASYCLLKSTDAEQEGAAEFLKWISKPAQNMSFAIESGYSPVTKEANNASAIKKAYSGNTTTSSKEQSILESLVISADAFSNSDAYATKPFNGSKDVRSYLGDVLEKRAIEDRKLVVSAMKKGSSRKEAVASFSSDAYFTSWFEEVKTKIEELTQ